MAFIRFIAQLSSAFGLLAVIINGSGAQAQDTPARGLQTNPPVLLVPNRIFDAIEGASHEGWAVLVDSKEIKTVGPKSDVKVPTNALIIDLPGMTLLPGLSDIHSHIFLHPSQTGRDGNQEGIPNSMLEAMATGLPVFATEHGGIPEAIENGVSGLLVPERDDEALARALLNAAQDPGLLSRIGPTGAGAVRKKFDLQQQAQRLEEIYLRMIAKPN